MRIRTPDGIVVDTTTSDRQLQLRDVKPGQVFRYLRGNESNLYIMGRHGRTFHINGSVAYDGNINARHTPVIVYPDATIELGDEQHELPDGVERQDDDVPVVGQALRQWDDEPLHF